MYTVLHTWMQVFFHFYRRAYRNWVRRQLWTKHLGRNMFKWEHKNKVNLNKIWRDSVYKNNVGRDMAKAYFCGKGHEPLYSINWVLFLYSSSHYYFEENDSGLWSSESERLSPNENINSWFRCDMPSLWFSSIQYRAGTTYIFKFQVTKSSNYCISTNRGTIIHFHLHPKHTVVITKLYQSLCRPCRPISFQEVKASKFLDSHYRKVIRSTLRTGRLYPLGNIPGTHL
jgi:hypothetical protein